MNKNILAISLVLLLVITAGCVGSQKSMEPGNYPVPSKSDLSVQDTGTAGNVVQGDTLDRKIVSTASLTIEVKSVDSVFKEITKIVQANQGFISSSSTYDAGGRNNGQVTVRVPQKSFYSTIEQIEPLGTVKSKQISGQDVTEEFIDLGARLDNLKKQESRFQEILKNASTVKDVLEVERELERVRGDIESLTGRMNYLNQSIEMSTIAVNAMEPAPITGEGWGLTDALRAAVTGFIESVKGIIVFIGYILPIAVFIAVIIYIALGIKRKVLPRLR
ncbi:MAG: DUF4349 domain-containing protein [Candidatus Methanoperedens sp.]|nr:DUF4349 domain-containing protein [Candidatus Methanoperedens sp.]MCZ7395454.1 DUF4349 domain-containing protein [Candidatus Methanoperedens sp.]